MLRLMLFRHAKSDWPRDVDDRDRPLSERGRKAAPQMGRFMAEAGLVPGLVLVSPARRTRETWERASETMGDDLPAMREDSRLYLAPFGLLLKVIGETPPSVPSLMLVGHQPGLQELAIRLVGSGGIEDRTALGAHFPTAALAVIDFEQEAWPDILPASGRLERFVTPKLLGASVDD
ncbi:Phosphohistidine phosphatase SixA [Devosia sp. H5989]|nr:Phosphohistidine phosphatase SixA [Devosia sp. H5989]